MAKSKPLSKKTLEKLNAIAEDAALDEREA